MVIKENLSDGASVCYQPNNYTFILIVNYLLVDTVSVLFLRSDKLVHDEIQRVREVFEEAMEFETHGQNCKSRVVDQC